MPLARNIGPLTLYARATSGGIIPTPIVGLRKISFGGENRFVFVDSARKLPQEAVEPWEELRWRIAHHTAESNVTGVHARTGGQCQDVQDFPRRSEEHTSELQSHS